MYSLTDVACYPLASEEGTLQSTMHITCAREMASVAAQNMALSAVAAQYTPLPSFSLKFLRYSMTFFGVAEGM